MVRADLHCHSSASDGTRRPAEVVRAAAAAGVDVLALTDHDTVAGVAAAAAALPPGLRLLPGMELSCRYAGHSVHLLAYLFDPQHRELAAQCLAIRQGRQQRAAAMVERLAALGVPVTWEQVTSIAAGGRAHVPRYALDPAAAVALVREAGGVTVLAHPRAGREGWQLPAELIAQLAAAGLGGIEVAHPDHDEGERAALRTLASELGLAATGGSDDHGELTGDRIGCETTAPQDLAALLGGATGAAVLV